jgi:hypothetical protein
MSVISKPDRFSLVTLAGGESVAITPNDPYTYFQILTVTMMVASDVDCVPSISLDGKLIILQAFSFIVGSLPEGIVVPNLQIPIYAGSEVLIFCGEGDGSTAATVGIFGEQRGAP